MLRFTSESESAYCLQRIVNHSTIHSNSLWRGALSVLCAFYRYKHSSKKSAKCFCNLFTFLSPQSHCYQKCFQIILLLYVFSALHFDLSAIFRRLFFFSMIRGCTHRSIWGWQGLILLAHHPSRMLLQYLDGKVREMLTFAAGLPSTPKDKSLELVRLRS